MVLAVLMRMVVEGIVGALDHSNVVELGQLQQSRRKFIAAGHDDDSNAVFEGWKLNRWSIAGHHNSRSAGNLSSLRVKPSALIAPTITINCES